jgi:hypothetical protein
MPEELAVLIESNVAEFLLTMGMIGGGSQRVDDEITWTVGGSPIGYHNAVVRCDAPRSRGRALVEEWRTELSSRSLPGCWHLSPTMRPHELAKYLTEAGFEDGGDEPAMAAVLSDLSDPSSPADLEIARVKTDDDLEGYRNVLAAGFGEGPREADWVASVFAQAGVAGDGRGATWSAESAVRQSPPHRCCSPKPRQASISCAPARSSGDAASARP